MAEPVSTAKAAHKAYKTANKVSKKTTGKPIHYWVTRLLIILTLLPFLLIGMLPLMFGGGAAASACDPGPGLLPAANVDYNGDVASTLWHVAKSLGASDRVILAMYETALVESGMRNLNYGDRDSQGVFQQRPSQGWGTVAQVTNVSHATRTFLLGIGGTPQKPRGAIGLDKSWTGSPGRLAEAVQRSAFPERYDQREKQAREIIARMQAQYPNAALSVPTTTLAWTQIAFTRPLPEAAALPPAPPPAPVAPAAGTQTTIDYSNAIGPPSTKSTPGGVRATTTAGSKAVRQLGFNGVIGGLGSRPNASDHPVGLAIDTMTMSDMASGERIAQFFVRNAGPLKVKYVIWNRRIMTFDSRKGQWRPYSGRSPHTDHVHISFFDGGAANIPGAPAGGGVNADVPAECGGIVGAAVGSVTDVVKAGQTLGGYGLPLPQDKLTLHYVTKPHARHPSSDMPVPVGTSVMAVHGGKVAAVNPDNACGYGVVIAGDDGNSYAYCHASVVLVTRGQAVTAGQEIMKSGGAKGAPGAGTSTGPHLHLGIRRRGIEVCPQPMLTALFNKQPFPGIDSLPITGCVG